MKIFQIFLIFVAISWAGSTIEFESDGIQISIPYQEQSNSICLDKNHWDALVLLAKSQATCKADWNSLLEQTSKRDSLCNASVAELTQQVDTQTLRLSNYQSSWDELLRNQEKCQNTLAQCTAKGQEIIQQSPPQPQKNHWLWGLLGVIVGFALGFGIAL